MQTRKLLCAVAALVALPSAAQPKVSADPVLPQYGQPVRVELQDAPSTYIPATRYSINGSTIVIDYEYLSVGFGPYGPDFGTASVNLGELAPGNYDVTARLHDIDQPAGAAPKLASTSIAVIPPGPYGLYTVPVDPQAYASTRVMVKSAAYFDPASMRVTVSGKVIRVDFVYMSTPLGGGTAPDGMAMYGSVRIPGLAPGTYTLEGWGRTKDGTAERFFQRTMSVDSTTPVVEYYSPALDHYFMALGADEIALLDRGSQGDWKRTGYGFKAWTRPEYAPSNAVPVCRFYSKGVNSHFFTGSKKECDFLKALEQKQRADATASGAQFGGWGYEGIAFYSVMPVNGSCAPGTVKVMRAYNGRAAEHDSNHRFTADLQMHAAMTVGWLDEGAQLCSPQ